MPRWLVVLVLAILLPCYGFAAVGQSLAVTVAMADDDHGHAAAHLTQEAHHHDDDGSFHVDDSAESQQHLHADAWAASPALLAAGVTLPQVSERFLTPRSWAESPPPVPFLEGLRRPPRSIAH